MAVAVHSLANQQVQAFHDQLVSVYRDAFSVDPYCKEEAEVVDFAGSLPRHLEREGFRGVVALDDQTGKVVGFAYGYSNTPDQFWHQEVAKAMHPRIVTEWLMGSFRLVEMAVTPAVQGRGIGGLLHDHLLGGVPHQKAVLSTMAADTNAFRMYQKRGWRVLIDNHSFRGVARSYRIMGLELSRGDAALTALTVSWKK
jgi:GNAT superfamily N-acetyltransferase